MGSCVHVVGGGVIGLASAWELSRNGHTVTVVASAPGRDGASWVAAGMLAPVTEAQFGESALTALLVAGAGRWPAFAAALEEATGHDVGYDTTGTVTVALDASDRASLDDLLAYQHTLGLEAHRRSASECRALVPALSPALRGGIEVPGDHQVDNRALLAALAEACRGGGVTFVEGRVAALEDGPALVLADGSRLDADSIVLAAGTGLSAIDGLAGAGLPSLRPVKGHILRLGSPDTATPVPLLARTVRGLVHGRSVYLVPRRDGSVVVGATVEERGTDTAVRAGAVHELLCDALGHRAGRRRARAARGRHRPAARHARQHAAHRADHPRRRHRGRRPLSQRHPARPVHRRCGGRPRGAAPGRPAHRGTGAGVTALALHLNGEPVEVRPGATIADLVADLTAPDDPKGVAVAVDRCVIPRSEWATTPARAGSLVEVVTAAAGG